MPRCCVLLLGVSLGACSPEPPRPAAETHGSTTWLKISTPRTLQDADEDCRARGGHLARVDTPAQAEIARRLAGQDWTWVGPVSASTGRTMVPGGELQVQASAGQAFLCQRSASR